MLVVMNNSATEAQIAAVSNTIVGLGYTPHPIPGAQRTAICITGNRGAVATEAFSDLEGIHEIIRVSKPYKLVSRDTKSEDTIVHIGEEAIGSEQLVAMAGPCSVESSERTLRIAGQLCDQGVTIFRAGAFKPRTSPYSFQGLGKNGLRILEEVKKSFGMTIVTEALDLETLDCVAEVADVIQIGARNMHNTALLKQLGTINKPVLLKRGMSATIEEFLMAAEYILAAGNYQVILCERGIRTFADHSRFTLDVAAVSVLQRITHLPVVVDPSHAAGRSELVEPLALAAAAAGAHGLLVEVHDNPAVALSDGAQALTIEKYAQLQRRTRVIRSALGRLEVDREPVLL